MINDMPAVDHLRLAIGASELDVIRQTSSSEAVLLVHGEFYDTTLALKHLELDDPTFWRGVARVMEDTKSGLLRTGPMIMQLPIRMGNTFIPGGHAYVEQPGDDRSHARAIAKSHQAAAQIVVPSKPAMVVPHWAIASPPLPPPSKPGGPVL